MYLELSNAEHLVTLIRWHLWPVKLINL